MQQVERRWKCQIAGYGNQRESFPKAKTRVSTASIAETTATAANAVLSRIWSAAGITTTTQGIETIRVSNEIAKISEKRFAFLLPVSFKMRFIQVKEAFSVCV